MKILHFINSLGIGGAEKSACIWAREFVRRGNLCYFISLRDGDRKSELTASSVPVYIFEINAKDRAIKIADCIKQCNPDVIHAHAPGYPHEGDVLGDALVLLDQKIPVVQTNIFGMLKNSKEDKWTDFRLYVSWTSCVQAAARSKRKLKPRFFEYQSVASNPLEPASLADAASKITAAEILNFRLRHHIKNEDVLFAKFARPDPVKWSLDLIKAFGVAYRKNPNIKLLLREPPADFKKWILREAKVKESFFASIILLSSTSNQDDLLLSQLACDVVLHTSTIGESFGYGLAEPMALGKPVVTNSLPWGDQAQLELTDFGKSGMVVYSQKMMVDAILKLSADRALREKIGAAGKKHISNLADLKTSSDRLESIYIAAMKGEKNPFCLDDSARANVAGTKLQSHQWGKTFFIRTLNRYFCVQFWSFQYTRAIFHRFKKCIQVKSIK